MAKYILFDTETTGALEEDRIIQIAAMVVDSSGEVEIFDELCSSPIPIKIEAMEVHNITPEMIDGKPKVTDTPFYKRLNELNSSENFLIAHNLPFDLGMITKEGFKSKLTHIDTLRCAKHLLKNSPYHRLQYLRYSLGLYLTEEGEAKKHNIHIKAHDAIGDVLVMKLLLSHLVTLAKADSPQTNPMSLLYGLTNTPVFIEVFKFGKYKDKKIADVAREDIGYIRWMQKNLELDEDLRFTLNQY